jgi:type VI protein secretion system component VasK
LSLFLAGSETVVKERLSRIFILMFLAWGAYLLWWDCQHPEVWDSQPLHDPRWYWPALALLGVVILALFADLIRRQLRSDRRNRRIDNLIAQAKEHMRQRRWAEAEAAVKSAERLLNDKR